MQGKPLIILMADDDEDDRLNTAEAFREHHLANDFHTYYSAHQFIVEDPGMRNARLDLALAAQTVIRNGLGLLGVSAPTTM